MTTAQEESMSSTTITRPPVFPPALVDVMADDDPPFVMSWGRAVSNSGVFTGKWELVMVLALMAWAGETTGKVDCCDAGYEETASAFGFSVAKVRAARKHAVDAGFIVELPDGCLQLMIPAGSDTSRI
jgi:hypothetical protein